MSTQSRTEVQRLPRPQAAFSRRGRPQLPSRPSKRQRQVASLVTQLARAARSYSLYSADNDVVRRLLEALSATFTATLAATPRLQLLIRPFELLFEEQCVYLDRDCERSLAFRLFGDGVRGLVFHAGLEPAETERLVSALASRYRRTCQDEEDAVTLLSRARLRFVEVVSVLPIGQDPVAAGGPILSVPQRRPYLPEDVDLPLPEMASSLAPALQALDAATLEQLRREMRAEPAEESLRLLSILGRILEDPIERMRFSEVATLWGEVQRAFLSIDKLPVLNRAVAELRRLSWSIVEWDPERHQAVVATIVSFGTDRVVKTLIGSVPEGQFQVPPGLIEFLDVVCPDPVTAVSEALAAESRVASRAVARQLMEHYGRRQGPSLRHRFQEARGQIASDLLRSLTRVEDGATPEFVARQCGHPDAEVRAEALWHLERSPFTSALGQALAEVLRRTEGDDRQRLLAIVERSRDRRFVPSLLRLIEIEREPGTETLEIARLVGRLEGPQGLERWRRHLTPGGSFFRRRLPGTVPEQLVAVAAVAEIPGDEAAHLLRLALSVADRRLRPVLEGVLEQRGGRNTKVRWAS